MPLGNMGGLTFVVILVVILVLFGAPKLPALSKSIADSLKIFKKEMKDTPENDAPAEKTADTVDADKETPKGE